MKTYSNNKQNFRIKWQTGFSDWQYMISDPYKAVMFFYTNQTNRIILMGEKCPLTSLKVYIVTFS